MRTIMDGGPLPPSASDLATGLSARAERGPAGQDEFDESSAGKVGRAGTRAFIPAPDRESHPRTMRSDPTLVRPDRITPAALEAAGPAKQSPIRLRE